jgi:hypothetical protein
MDDALLSLIISETVNASSLARRKSAVLLAHAINVETQDTGASVEILLARVSAEDGAEIVASCDFYGIPKISN